MSDEYKFEDFQNQNDEIEREQKTRPYLTDKLPLESLTEEYQNMDIILNIYKMTQSYRYFRRVRGDGNCFYRALAFGIFEYLIRNNNESVLNRVIEVFSDKVQFMLAGYDEFIFEDFQGVVLEILNKIEKKDLTVKQLESLFLDGERSEYVVIFMRLCTSAYIQFKKDDYAPFLYEYESVIDFCRKEVEAMGKEADNMQISALLARLSPICIKIEYLDSKSQNTILFPEDGNPIMTFLYRPGHYDILYEN
jgi:ubiquitin thioesterase protein OTUB1